MICRSGAASEPLSELPGAAWPATGAAATTCSGKVFEADVLAFAQEDRAFDDVLQLAYVSRPAITFQCASGLLR